jgi:hypothetical protein
MQVAQRSERLEFDDDLGIFANDHIIVKYDNPPLLDDSEPRLSHLVGNGIPIDHFNEPKAERIGNPESTPNDLLGSPAPTAENPLHPSASRLSGLKPALASVPTPDGARMSYAARGSPELDDSFDLLIRGILVYRPIRGTPRCRTAAS